MGISAPAVHRLVRLALETYYNQLAEDTEALRRIELERLDVAQAAIWPLVVQGDLNAIDRLLRISARRAALLGLDAPVKQEAKASIEIEPFDYASAIAQITTRSIGDSRTPSEDEDSGDGQALGEDDSRG